jgi:hypothetical protein
MENVPHIDDAISAREAKVERLRRELEIEEAELRGMKLMRDHFAQASAARSPVAFHARRTQSLGEALIASREKESVQPGYKGGRQPGAISKSWRLILSELYWDGAAPGQIGATFDVQRVIYAAQKRGIQLRPSEVSTRMAHYETFDYVGSVPGGWRVSMAAAERFGFLRSPLKNEAPNAKAQEPHEFRLQAEQTGAD